jgi:sec-independent protein translocase protein TatA
MFSMPDMAVILVIVLIVFGPGKLPDIGSALGKGLNGLRKATEEEEPVSEKAPELQKLQSIKAEPLETKTTAPDRTTASP